jgi:hypothetical protein
MLATRMLHSGSQFLRRSVLLRGVRLGVVEDVLLDGAGRRVFGFVVLCGDGAPRMLPLPAVDGESGNGHLAVSSALVLMDNGYYQERARSFTALLDAGVRRGGVTIGTLSDLRFDETGRVRLLDVDGLGELPATDDLAIDPEARPAAD